MQPTIHLKNSWTEQEISQLQTILEMYHIGTETTWTITCSKLSGWLCNTTYKIETDSGKYILQQVAPAMPEHITKDIAVITSHLSKKWRQIPLLKKNKHWERESLHKDGSKRRMCTYVPNHDSLSTQEMLKNVYHAGKLLAEFHADIRDLTHTFVSPWFENFHNTPFYIQKLGKLLPDFAEHFPDLMEDILYVTERWDERIHESSFGNHIIHADAKLANVLFDASWKAFTIIDFDTLMHGNPMMDLGDMLRSCLHDDGDAIITFNEQQIKDIITWYYDFSDLQESMSYETFYAHALHSLMVLLIEQGTRNFIDIVEDYYYSPSSPKFSSRRERNTAMATNHIVLAKRIEQLIRT